MVAVRTTSLTAGAFCHRGPVTFLSFSSMTPLTMNQAMRYQSLRFVAAVLLFASRPCFAAVPLPDHLLYGTLALNGRPVTSTQTNVWVEARRAVGGPVIASYRMGSSRRLGDHYYALRIPVGEAGNETSPVAQPGENLLVTVRDAGVIHHRATHPLAEPAAVLRLDFGATLDADGDGVPDGWELVELGTAGGLADGDSDGDGLRDSEEYASGTRPRDPNDVFRLATQIDADQVSVSFRALAALGVGFEGRTRFYALEATTDPAAGAWQVVENQSRIPGTGQLVVYAEPSDPENPRFFRARVWLEGP